MIEKVKGKNEREMFYAVLCIHFFPGVWGFVFYDLEILGIGVLDNGGLYTRGLGLGAISSQKSPAWALSDSLIIPGSHSISVHMVSTYNIFVSNLISGRIARR